LTASHPEIASALDGSIVLNDFLEGNY